MQTTSAVARDIHAPQFPQSTTPPPRAPTETKPRYGKTVPRHRSDRAAHAVSRTSAPPPQENYQSPLLPPEIRFHADARPAKSCSTAPARLPHPPALAIPPLQFFDSAAASLRPAPSARSHRDPSQKILPPRLPVAP